MTRNTKIILMIMILLLGFATANAFIPHLSDRLDTHKQVVDIVIANKKMVKPGDTITIREGKKVMLLITADEDEEFHLEGYHAFTPFKAGERTLLEFEALTKGRFSIVLDKSHHYIGIIEVI